MSERKAFGARLRRERERRGVGLDVIAEQTKVNVALLESLERGDVSRWPAGIFRRAFLRAYAESIGLDSRAVLHEFLTLFPDEESDEPIVATGTRLPDAEPLRLTLAREGGFWRAIDSRRLLAVGIDLGLVAVLSLLVWLVGIASAPAYTVAAVAVAYFAAGTLLTGSTFGVHCARRWRMSRPTPAGGDLTIGADTSRAMEQAVSDAGATPARRLSSHLQDRVSRWGRRGRAERTGGQRLNRVR